MNKKLIVRYDMFRDVRQFGLAHVEEFPETSPAGRAFSALSTVLTTSTPDAAAAATGAREAFVEKRTARQALASQIKAIARTARVIGETTPGFEDRFVLPVPKSNALLLQTAQEFLRDSQPVSAQLIAAGLPGDFAARLQVAATAYEQTLAEHAASRVAAKAARASLNRAIRTGMTAVRTIDAVVRYQFAADAAMQETWKRVKTLSGLPDPKVTPVAPVTTPPPAGRTPETPVAVEKGGDTTIVTEDAA